MPNPGGMRVYRIYEDLRQAFRLIASNKTLALGVFLSLSLGIGVSTSIFSLMNSVLFRTLPAPQADRVVQIASVNPASAVDPISYADFADMRKRTSTFETLATTQDEGVAMDTHTGAPPRMTLGLITRAESSCAARTWGPARGCCDRRLRDAGRAARDQHAERNHR